MQEFLTLFGDVRVGTIIIILAAVGFLIKEGRKLNTTLRKLYDKENEQEEKFKQIDRNTADIACIKSNIGELIAQVEANSEESREYRRTSLSDKIFRKYREYTKRGEITKDELENFRVCVNRYVKTIKEEEEQNDLVLTKYFPDVKRLPISMQSVDWIDNGEEGDDYE